MRTQAKVTEIDGKLAVDLDWFTSWTEPIRECVYYVAKHLSADSYQFLMDHPVSFRENTGFVLANYRRYVFQFDDERAWTRVVKTEKVKKPRRGKKGGQRYDWEWKDGRWRKVWLD